MKFPKTPMFSADLTVSRIALHIQYIVHSTEGTCVVGLIISSTAWRQLLWPMTNS